MTAWCPSALVSLSEPFSTTLEGPDPAPDVPWTGPHRLGGGLDREASRHHLSQRSIPAPLPLRCTDIGDRIKAATIGTSMAEHTQPAHPQRLAVVEMVGL